MDACECARYDHLELYRRNIDRRILETKHIEDGLTFIAEHPSGIYKLFKCEVCGQFWQSSLAWNWDNKEYTYKVPSISTDDWLAEPYIQPDHLLIYNAVMSDWYDRNVKAGNFKESDRPCRRENCPNMALEGLAQCLEHHIEDLQRVRALPKPPQGRWFLPYKGS